MIFKKICIVTFLHVDNEITRLRERLIDMRFLIAVLVILIGGQWVYSTAVANEAIDTSDYQVIPDEAIRLRILAHSNSEEDQKLKNDVRDVVNQYLTDSLEKLTSIEEARSLINNNLPTIESLVQETINDDNFTVEFGEVAFPDKIYDNFVYPGGDYEAILITIGSGEGDNWWCVLFPPLCFVDFSNGATVLEHDEELEEEDDTEVKFFLWELVKKIISFFT